jgi:hypothetical protein
MVADGSTGAEVQAKAHRAGASAVRSAMHRMFLLVVLLGLVVLGVGFLVLGAFPPEPHPQQIQKVLPNDRFQPSG